MIESEIYDKLEELRAGFNPTSETVSSVEKIEFDGKTYEKRVWSEPYENSTLFVFLLESEKDLSTKTYCLGLLVNPNGDTKQLSNQQLWDIGIP